MSERDLLELIASQVNKLSKDVDYLRENMATKQELGELKQETDSLKTIVVRIENDFGTKINALFDGYTLNAEKLDRIEKEVTKHEEVILRRVQ